MFTPEKLQTFYQSIQTREDAFTATADLSYILYLFNRGSYYECRLVHQFLDRFDKKINDIYLENFEIPKNANVSEVVEAMLNEKGLLVGGSTKLRKDLYA